MTDGNEYRVWPWACIGLLTTVVLPLAYWDTHDPERIERRDRMDREGKARVVACLRCQALASLPPDATDVTVTCDAYPVGWLTFVRVESGKPAKFLVCYKRDQATGEFSLSVARAD